MLHEKLFNAVLNGDAKATVAEIEASLANNVTPRELLEECLIPPMAEAGRLFEIGDFFVPELLIASRAMQHGMKILNPLLKASGVEKVGCVVIGTVKGDMHDIGKNLVGSMLEGGGFEVIDLGVDVSQEQFVEAAKANPGAILGLSALLTTTMPQMPAVLEALKNAKLRDSVKVMIGGAPVTSEFASHIGADGYSDNASSAVALARKLLAY